MRDSFVELAKLDLEQTIRACKDKVQEKTLVYTQTVQTFDIEVTEAQILNERE